MATRAQGRAVWIAVRWPLLVAAVVIGLHLRGVFDPLESMAVDARFLFRGYQLATSDVTVVGITQQCIDRIGHPPWPRSVYAKAIRELKAAGATTICFDVFFPATTTEAEDRDLVEAVQAAGNVVCPVFCPVELHASPPGDPFRHVSSLRGSFPALQRAAAGLAHINVPPGADGKCRSAPLGLEYQETVYFGLGIEGARQFLEAGTRAGGQLPAAVRDWQERLPLAADGAFLINYCGQQTTFDFLPFHKLLEGKYPKGLVLNKLVLVGQTALGQVNADMISTPMGQMYGVFVQGIITDNVLTGKYLRRMRPLEAVCMILVLALATGLLFRCLHPVVLVASWAGCTTLVVAAAALLFNRYGLIVEVVPAVTTVAGTFAVAIAVSLKRSRAEVRLKEGELARIFESSRMVTTEAFRQQTLDVLLRLIGETVGAEFVSLAVVEPPGWWHWQTVRASRRMGGSGMLPENVQAFESRVHPLLLKQGRPCLAERGKPCELLPGIQVPFHAFVSMPLTVREHVLGLLSFYNKRSSARSSAEGFSEDDLRVIAVFARQVALILDNTRLVGDLAAKNCQLEETLAQLRTAQGELVQREKLSVVGKMASMIIHDIRGPLAAASCYAEMVQRLDFNAEEVKDYARNIVVEINRINGMAQEVLDFTRGSRRMALEPVAVSKLVDDFVDRFQHEVRQTHVALKIECLFRGMVVCDREKMLNVFVNLSRNAVEAMNGGGSIRFVCRQEGTNVEFSVIDTGEGIPSEIRERIFEPFVTYGKARGTGLGLAIVKKIVDDHGATIQVYSETGKGSRFVVRLPLTEEVAAASG